MNILAVVLLTILAAFAIVVYLMSEAMARATNETNAAYEAGPRDRQTPYGDGLPARQRILLLRQEQNRRTVVVIETDRREEFLEQCGLNGWMQEVEAMLEA